MDIPLKIANGTSPVIVRPEDPIISILQFVIPIIISAVTAFFLWYQIRKQTKVDSARFSMDFLERTSKKFKKILIQIKEKAKKRNTTPYVSREIRLLLNHFEYIAMFEADGVINIKHIDEIFGQALLRIGKDVEILQIMESNREDDKTIYHNLISLLEKIKKKHPSHIEV